MNSMDQSAYVASPYSMQQQQQQLQLQHQAQLAHQQQQAQQQQAQQQQQQHQARVDSDAWSFGLLPSIGLCDLGPLLPLPEIPLPPNSLTSPPAVQEEINRIFATPSNGLLHVVTSLLATTHLQGVYVPPTIA